MANISLEKPSEQMYSKAIDCVVDYLKNKELKILGGSSIESMSYLEWLDFITSTYFIFDGDCLIGFVEFKDENLCDMSASFSLSPTARNMNYYSDVIEVLYKKGIDYGCSSLLFSFPASDINLIDYVKSQSELSSSLHLSDSDIAYFMLQLS